MTSKKALQPRSIYKSKSAAERLLESPLSPTPYPFGEQNKKKELKRTTGYYRPEQVTFMRAYCESLRKKFHNENIKPPLLQRVLFEMWNEETARNIEEYMRQQGYDKSQE